MESKQTQPTAPQQPQQATNAPQQQQQQRMQGQNPNQKGYHQKRNNYRGRGGKGFYQNQGGRNYGYNRNSNRGQQNNYQNQNRGIANRNYFCNPYMAQEMIYRTEMYIYTKYHHLIDINVKSKGLSQTLTEDSTFYVIKSFSEEDVHKSIKYGVWSSSKNGNTSLTNSFRLAKEKNGNVYLIFSSKSNSFLYLINNSFNIFLIVHISNFFW